MDGRLNMAAEEGDINMLYTLLAEDPYLLERIDQIPIVDTPLHIAASAGKTHFVMEIASLKPSLAWKLNHNGLSPVHLALQNGHIQTVRGLIIVDSELIRVKGRERITPLHYVTEVDDVDLLAEFLSSCPLSIEDLTIRCETAMHIAVKNNRFRAFKVMLGWLQRVNMEEVLNWKDEEGNSVLHIATYKNQPQVMKLLIKHVNINAKNFAGLTALDIFLQGQSQNRNVGDILRRAKAKSCSSHESTTSLADYFSRELSLLEKRDKYLGLNDQNQTKSPSDVRSTVLVVAILIATATYQATLSPPGGYWQDDYNQSLDITNNSSSTNLLEKQSHHAGQMIMKSQNAYYFFTLNTAAFYASIYTILTIIMGLPYSSTLFVSICFPLYSYYYSVVINFPWQPKKYILANIVFKHLTYICAVLTNLIPYLAFRWQKRIKARVDTLRKGLGNRMHVILDMKMRQHFVQFTQNLDYASRLVL